MVGLLEFVIWFIFLTIIHEVAHAIAAARFGNFGGFGIARANNIPFGICVNLKGLIGIKQFIFVALAGFIIMYPTAFFLDVFYNDGVFQMYSVLGSCVDFLSTYLVIIKRIQNPFFNFITPKDSFSIILDWNSKIDSYELGKG